MTTVYRGERRDVKSFTPEEHQDYLDKKQHTINEAKEAIAGMKGSYCPSWSAFRR